MENESPMRINKYIAQLKNCTRAQADEMVAKGLVTINGTRAKLGDKVSKNDTVDVKFRLKKFRYFAYYKPRGIITHSPQGEEEEIADTIPLKDVFPIGRLDKDSFGLIILTDDGRLSGTLLDPEHDHEKEYEVTTRDLLPKNFKWKMEHGVDIGGYVTKPCTVRILGEKKFAITLTEGKKHQIRRMCGALGASAVALKRTRILNIRLGSLKPGEYQEIAGNVRAQFLGDLGII
ncbi:MAG TPA: pseudouridine synthase [Candidatus Paceibacterota bacterium]|nr:pseudouridine synthase [Candidatus Paceibacterota bacterium]